MNNSMPSSHRSLDHQRGLHPIPPKLQSYYGKMTLFKLHTQCEIFFSGYLIRPSSTLLKQQSKTVDMTDFFSERSVQMKWLDKLGAGISRKTFARTNGNVCDTKERVQTRWREQQLERVIPFCIWVRLLLAKCLTWGAARALPHRTRGVVVYGRVICSSTDTNIDDVN